PTTLGARADRSAARRDGWLSGARRLLVAIITTVAVVLVCWWLAAAIMPGGHYLARGPWDVLPYLASESTNVLTAGTDSGGPAWQFLLYASGQTFLDAGIGFLAGLLVAVLAAAAAFQWPSVEQALMPVSVALRSVPIVAAMPLLALVFGRTLLAVTVLVT